MRGSREGGQAMVELALGISIFLLAAFGAVQLGLYAIAEEGAQGAALIAARAASAGPLADADPVAGLAVGEREGLAALGYSTVGLAAAQNCGDHGCGLPTDCVPYHDGRISGGDEVSCARVEASASLGDGYGPAAAELDGSQNPGCSSGSCFGVATSMARCSGAAPPGHLYICLAYDGWPPSDVDVWIRGSLRTLLPLPGAEALDLLPVNVRMRLSVERFRQ